MSYNTKNYTEQGGDVTHFGGKVIFEEGSEVEGLPAPSVPDATTETKGIVKQGVSVTDAGDSDIKAKLNALLSSLRNAGVIESPHYVIVSAPHTDAPFDITGATAKYYKSNPLNPTQYVDGDCFCYGDQPESTGRIWYPLQIVDPDDTSMPEDERWVVECAEGEAEMVYRSGAVSSKGLKLVYSKSSPMDKKLYYKINADSVFGTLSFEDNTFKPEDADSPVSFADLDETLEMFMAYEHNEGDVQGCVNIIGEDDIDDSGKCICLDWFNQTAYLVKKVLQ